MYLASTSQILQLPKLRGIAQSPISIPQDLEAEQPRLRVFSVFFFTAHKTLPDTMFFEERVDDLMLS